MNLYELQAGIMECVSEDGELLDIEKFESLNMEIDTKIENLCLWVKNLDAECEAIRAEEKALADRRKRKENLAERNREYVKGFLDGRKFETSKVAISYRKSEQIEIEEGAIIPDEYLNPQPPKVDKTLLKKAIKAGEVFDGIQLVEKQNMQIK